MRASCLSICLLTLLLAMIQSKPTQSIYKVRMHQSFLQELFSKNLHTIIQHTDAMQPTETYLPDVDTIIESISLNLVPMSEANRKKNDKKTNFPTELILEENQNSFVIELGDVVLKGQAQATVGNNQAKEAIKIVAGLDSAKITILMSQQKQENGDTVPKFKVDKVQFKLSDKIRVNSKEERPMYKTPHFEQAVSDWLAQTLVQRERDFALKFSESFDEWVELFDFSKLALNRPDLVGTGVTETISDSIQVQGDYVTGIFKSEFECKEDEDQGFEKDLRRQWSNDDDIYDSPEVAFIETDDFLRDVQIVFDENFVNEIFFNLFHTKGSIFSLNEQLLKMIYLSTEKIASHPMTSSVHKQYASLQDKGINMAMERVMNTKNWVRFFPSLGQDEESKAKPVDLRCSFSKDFVANKLDLSKITQVQFHKDNIIDFQGLFGCGLHIYEGKGSPFVLQKASAPSDFDEEEQDIPDDLFADDDEDEDGEGGDSGSKSNKEWVTHRGFFGSSSGMVQYDFSLHEKKDLSPLQGQLTTFDLDFSELRVFEDDVEIEAEKGDLSAMIEFLKMTLLRTGLKTVFGELNRFINLPMTPFMELERCLGIKAKNSIVQINEGYVNLAFDYAIKKPVNEECLRSTQKISQKGVAEQVTQTITKNMPGLKRLAKFVNVEL